MDFKFTKKELFNWCSIPVEELDGHKDLKVDLRLHPDRRTTMINVGNMMADELIEHNNLGIVTKWILPAGPMDEYNVFIERVNRERINCQNLFIFHMDEFLDWEGRPYPIKDTYESLEGTMNAGFYNRIDPELGVPVENRYWPRINDLDRCDDKIEEMGGVDTVWAGVGAHGLVAFCEAPRMYWHRISEEEYANSRTRIVDISEDTIVALSQRTFGVCYDRIPPRSVTLGFKAMLSAKKAVLMIATGTWKNTVVRVALFSEPTLEYPVTLFAKYIPEVILMTDINTADHPMSHEIKGW